MRKLLLITSLFFAAVSCGASAEEAKKPWYHKDYDRSSVVSLQQVLTAQKDFMGPDNIGYRMQGSKEVCAALKAVKVACDYNTRGTLSMFLTVNGKGLFPAAGGTNPYYTAADREADLTRDWPYPDDGFIGQPVQNKMLADAVKRNAKLFKNGNLSVESIKSWK